MWIYNRSWRIVNQPHRVTEHSCHWFVLHLYWSKVTGNFVDPSSYILCKLSVLPPTMTSHSDTSNHEYEHISTSLEVEQLEVNLFRSKSLYMPARARGVFGGQVISQALVSATNCVSSSYALHSLHCYFLTTASATTPIVYQVDRVRDGSSYVTRGVRALQNGRTIFLMVCSFHKPEPWQPSHQWKMPDVPPPEQCESDEVRLRRLILDNRDSPEDTQRLKELLIQQEQSPVTCNTAKFKHVDENGLARFLYWIKARNVPKYQASFQKCILSYMSDFRFIYTSVVIAGLKGSVSGESGPQYLGMNSSIDHVVWFYDHDFDCGDWLLYEMECPRIGSGRAVVHGRIFTRHGKLVAVTSQEGVLRAKIRGPTGNTLEKQTPAKLWEAFKLRHLGPLGLILVLEKVCMWSLGYVDLCFALQSDFGFLGTEAHRKLMEWKTYTSSSLGSSVKGK